MNLINLIQIRHYFHDHWQVPLHRSVPQLSRRLPRPIAHLLQFSYLIRLIRLIIFYLILLLRSFIPFRHSYQQLLNHR